MSVVNVKSVYGTTVKEYYIGVSTDTKPTDVPIGAKFLESDTNTTYIFGADRAWSIDPEHQSLNKVWNADSLEWDRMTQPLVNISDASLFVEMASMDIQFTSINAKLTSQVSVQISAVSGIASANVLLASQNVLLGSLSAQVGSVNTILDAMSTRVGNISTIGGNISNVISGISNVLSGISARLSVLSTVIGSVNIWLGSIENMFDPLARYGLGFIDAGSATSYYGFQDKAGAWYVMRISNASYLYYQNSANFDTGWGSRATLSYNSFAGAF